MSNHHSYYDALAISARLEPVLKSIAASEIHLFAYLARLLALYRKKPTSDWGYEFGAISEGYPYSPALQESLESLIRRGSLRQDTDLFLRITPEGLNELSWLQSLSIGVNHEAFIDGACDSIISLPIGIIRDAIGNSADLHSAKSLEQFRHLPSDGGREEIYEQFEALSTAIGIEVQDLMIPAVIWLQFLATASTDNSEQA